MATKRDEKLQVSVNGVKDCDAAQRHRSCLVGAMNGVEHDLCCPTPFMLGTMICVGHESGRLTPFTVLDRRHRPRHRGSALICCRKTPFNDALMLDLCRRHRSNPDVVGLIGVTRAEKTEFRCDCDAHRRSGSKIAAPSPHPDAQFQCVRPGAYTTRCSGPLRNASRA